MTLETPFRLMWTDEEGDNVCFSTDEELAQALKFVKGQENQLLSHYQDSSGSTRTSPSCKRSTCQK